MTTIPLANVGNGFAAVNWQAIRLALSADGTQLLRVGRAAISSNRQAHSELRVILSLQSESDRFSLLVSPGDDL